VIPRNSTTRPPGVEERRRVEEQEEEQDHRKDPGFARPITLATTSSSRVGVLCEYFARFSFSRLGGGGLEDGGGHVGLGLGGRGGRFGIGLGGGLALVVVGDGGGEDGVGVGRAVHEEGAVRLPASAAPATSGTGGPPSAPKGRAAARMGPSSPACKRRR
jgi:hypothetical protein